MSALDQELLALGVALLMAWLCVVGAGRCIADELAPAQALEASR